MNLELEKTHNNESKEKTKQKYYQQIREYIAKIKQWFTTIHFDQFIQNYFQYFCAFWTLKKVKITNKNQFFASSYLVLFAD